MCFRVVGYQVAQMESGVGYCKAAVGVGRIGNDTQKAALGKRAGRPCFMARFSKPLMSNRVALMGGFEERNQHIHIGQVNR